MGSGEPLRRGDALSGNPRPPSYLTRRARQTSATLAKEAQETVASVKALVDDERKNMHGYWKTLGWEMRDLVQNIWVWLTVLYV